MDSELTQLFARSRAWFERVVAVDLPDSLAARRATMFNILMLVSVVVLMGMGLGFLYAGFQGWMQSPDYIIGALFPGFYIPFSLLCVFLVKRRVLWVIDAYIWFNLLTTAAACLIFDGYLAPAWLLFFWTVSFAGIFLKPSFALVMTGAALTLFLLLLLLSGLGVYQPYFQLSYEAREFFYLLFGLLMLSFTGGVITYLNMHNLGEALAQLQTASRDLESGQQQLEQQVAERTEELRHRLADFRTVAQLSQVLGGLQEYDAVLATSVDFISEQMGYYHVGLFLFDETRQWLWLRAASSVGGKRMLARGHRVQVGAQGLVGHVSMAGMSRMAFDIGDEAVWFSNPDLPKTRSELALPLVSRERVVGVLDIHSAHPNAFNDADVQVLEILADGLITALENTRMLQSTQMALARLNRYQEDDILRGWREALARRDLKLGYMYDQREVRAVDMLEPLPSLSDAGLQVLVREDGHYQLQAPVQVRGKIVGVLNFESPKPWSDEELQLAETVVLQLGLALENARLLEDTRLRARTEQARSEIVGRVRASVNVDAILRSAAEELGRALQLERARVQLLPGDSLPTADVSGR